jgi:hypothetical protein
MFEKRDALKLARTAKSEQGKIMSYMFRVCSTLLAAAAAMLSINVAYADDSGCDHQPAMGSFAGPTVSGTGKLCVLPSGLAGQVKLANLDPGAAYTVWWTYLDDPSLCKGDSSGTGGESLTGGVSGCELADFEGDKPLGIFGRMASAVAPRTGRLNLRGSLGGMQPSPGSEVWLWLFNHGPAAFGDGDALARQLLTPEDPNAGSPHLGNVVDGQLAGPAATVVFTVE